MNAHLTKVTKYRYEISSTKSYPVALTKIRPSEKLLLLGDFNACVGCDHESLPGLLERHGVMDYTIMRKRDILDVIIKIVMRGAIC